jgi:hypothetical protein
MVQVVQVGRSPKVSMGKPVAVTNGWQPNQVVPEIEPVMVLTTSRRD